MYFYLLTENYLYVKSLEQRNIIYHLLIALKLQKIFTKNATCAITFETDFNGSQVRSGNVSKSPLVETSPPHKFL